MKEYNLPTTQDALSSLSSGDSIRHIVSISGGKDSAALALYLRQEYPEIPVEYVFCDTGCELPETYEFIERIEALLGATVHRLNALDLLNVRKKAGRTPFDVYLNELYGGFLPSARARWCTRVLKIEPFEAFVGEDTAYSYIGIRGDEDRDGYQAKKPPVISQQPNILPVYPFKDDKKGLQDILDILERSGLGLPEYYKWRSRSGCYFCFYQQIGEWQRLKDEHPDLFKKAEQYEKTVGAKSFTWHEGRTLEEISELSDRHPVPNDRGEGCTICHV